MVIDINHKPYYASKKYSINTYHQGLEDNAMMDYQLIQQISRCIPYRERSEAAASYDFPIDEIMYRFMKSARIEYLYGGTDGLVKLYEEYTLKKPALFQLQDLLDDQWIRLEFGEWHPTLHAFREESLNDFRDGRLKDTITFLLFLRKKEWKYYKKAVIDNPGKILRKFKRQFPNTPLVDWFVEKRILQKNGRKYIFHRDHWEYSTLINKAAAKVWAFDVDHNCVKEKQKWFDIACVCSVTSGLLKYLGRRDRATLLQWLVEITEQEKWVGSVERENKIVTRLALSQYYTQLADMTYDAVSCGSRHACSFCRGCLWRFWAAWRSGPCGGPCTRPLARRLALRWRFWSRVTPPAIWSRVGSRAALSSKRSTKASNVRDGVFLW